MFYNGNEFLKAMQLAEEMKFEQEDIYFKHSDTILYLFESESGLYWSINGVGKSGYYLCFNEVKVCPIGKELELKLDAYIELILNANEIEEQNKEEFRMLQDELWKNTNNNHFYN